MHTLNDISDYYLLHGLFMEEIGLQKGKMGLALFYFLYARRVNNPWLEKYAFELLENVCDQLSYRTPVTFVDGLCGIGWSIGWLIHTDMIEGDADEILYDLDYKVMEIDVDRLKDHSFLTGLEGIAVYVQSRISYSENHPFDAAYLTRLKQVCTKTGIPFSLDSYDWEDTWKNLLQSFFIVPTVNEEPNWQNGLIKLMTEE